MGTGNLSNFKDKLFSSIASDLMQEVQVSNGEMYRPDFKWSASETAVQFKKRESDFRAEFIEWLFKEICRRDQHIVEENINSEVQSLDGRNEYPVDQKYDLDVLMFIFGSLFKSKQVIKKESLIEFLIYALCSGTTLTLVNIDQWPLKTLMNKLKPTRLSQEDKSQLLDCVKGFKNLRSYQYHTNYFRKLTAEVEELVFAGTHDERARLLLSHMAGDEFGRRLTKHLKSLSEEERNVICEFLWNLKHSDGAKPTNRFNKLIEKPLQELEKDKRVTLFKQVLKIANATRLSSEQAEDIEAKQLFNKHNASLLKGLVWVSADYLDKEMLELLAKLERRCLAKIPNRGAGAKGVANAIGYVWTSIPFQQ